MVEKNKEYKIKVGNTQSVLDVRWRVGYYYDLYVNEVVFMNEDGSTKINLLDEWDVIMPHNKEFASWNLTQDLKSKTAAVEGSHK